MGGSGSGAVNGAGPQVIPPNNGAIVEAQLRPPLPTPTTTPVPATQPTERERPPAVGDATPKQTDPGRPGTVTPRSDAPASLSPAVMQSFRERFGVDFTRLPPAELQRVTAAYNEFMRDDTGPRNVPAFLQTIGRALVTDRQRVVGDMAANPPEQLVRLAPALERQAGLMRVAQSAELVDRLGDMAFLQMRNRLFSSKYSREVAMLTPEAARSPQTWQRFMAMYGEAVGPNEMQRLSVIAGRTGAARSVVADYIAAIGVLHQPGTDGSSTLLRAEPKQIAEAATRSLVQLGRDNPGLQAFSPEQVAQMAGALRLPGTEQSFTFAGDPPRLTQRLRVVAGGTTTDLLGGSDAPGFAAYQAQLRARLNEPSIRRGDPRYPADINGLQPQQFVSALTVFRDGTSSTALGLGDAAIKLRDSTMTANDLLPLAYQMQEHVVGQLFTNGELRPGTVAALGDLWRATTQAEQHAQRERYIRGGVAVAGLITGVGLLASGPLGWGVGITSTLAAGAGASAVTTMALDVAEYRDRLRAGGLNQAGLVLTNLERENGAGLAASLALNAAGALAGIPAVTAAQRLQYASGLITATRVEDAAARTAAVATFVQRNSLLTAAEWQALSPERQATALRLVERFGSEVDSGGMRAILQYGARDAEVTNGTGAVANVDHMFAAYSEMNVAEVAARGRPLTSQERTINAIATVGTDAQGKFGHAALPIIPTEVPGGVARNSAEFLRGVRERAVRDAFAGIERASPAVDRQALTRARDRYMREVAAETDPGKRNAAMKAINDELQATSPEARKWVGRQFDSTDYGIRMQPFVEGPFVHNVVDPGSIFTMGRAAGLSEADAAEAAYRATMHGFGNAFVATAYPGMPRFASVMRPGTSTPLFNETQLGHLDRVGRASLRYNQEVQPTVAQATRWGIAGDPPPRGVRQIYTAALRANGGQLPEGLQTWLFEQGAMVRQTRLDAGIGAGATNADNLGNYVPEGMRKWAGIFSAGDYTPSFNRTIGDQVERLIGGVNGYAIEEFSVGNIARFDANFASSAARLGLQRPKGAATYEWFMARRTANGPLEIKDNADASVIRSAAAAIRERFANRYSGRMPDRDVVSAFYNEPQAGDLQSALALIAEGNLPPAFNAAAAMRNAHADRRLSGLTQLLLYQQAIAQGVRSYDRQ